MSISALVKILSLVVTLAPSAKDCVDDIIDIWQEDVGTTLTEAQRLEILNTVLPDPDFRK